MVGVSSPIYSDSRRRGFRFNTGFLAGSVVSALLISMILFPVHAALQLVPLEGRRLAFVTAAILFGGLDLAGRTPFFWRQVPQRLYLQGMDVGRLGVVYGADMGLHVTTLKVTSLLWVVFTGSLLVGSAAQIVGVLAIAALTTSALLFVLAASEQGRFVDAKLTIGGAISWETAARWIAAALSAGLALIELTRVGWLW